MSSKDLLTTRLLGPMVPSWELKVCILSVTLCEAQVVMKFEAHCSWIQTCRPSSLGDNGHDAEFCARPHRFPTAPQLYLQCKRTVWYVRRIADPSVNRNTGCLSSMSSLPEGLWDSLR